MDCINTRGLEVWISHLDMEIFFIWISHLDMEMFLSGFLILDFSFLGLDFSFRYGIFFYFTYYV
jgi:hypothetical protein